LPEKNSSRGGLWTRRSIFRVYSYEEAGAVGDFQTSYAETDTPVKTFYYRKPVVFKQGIATRLHLRMNQTNAVTLLAVRIYAAAHADNYASCLRKMYDSTADFPAGFVDDDEYEIELDVPFILTTAGVVYYALEWSGAPGLTPGFIELSGEVIH